MQGEISELQVHFWMVLVMIALALQAFVLLLLVNAPYGRFARAGWGPTMSTRRAWIIFESPAVVVFAAIYFAGDNALETVPLIFFSIWQFHYIVRTLIFPFRIRETGKTIPVVIVAVAIIFNVLNAYINARWISHLGQYDVSWLASPAFVIGVVGFFAGWAINQHSDLILFRLRPAGETHYKIPVGGLYRWVSCPNHLGEIIMWCGWAVATWSYAGTAMAFLTIANLAPRAAAIHRWYKAEFDDYPKSRKAIIPFVY